jgi:hypothetical protein
MRPSAGGTTYDALCFGGREERGDQTRGTRDDFGSDLPGKSLVARFSRDLVGNQRTEMFLVLTRAEQVGSEPRASADHLPEHSELWLSLPRAN